MVCMKGEMVISSKFYFPDMLGVAQNHARFHCKRSQHGLISAAQLSAVFILYFWWDTGATDLVGQGWDGSSGPNLPLPRGSTSHKGPLPPRYRVTRILNPLCCVLFVIAWDIASCSFVSFLINLNSRADVSGDMLLVDDEILIPSP